MEDVLIFSIPLAKSPGPCRLLYFFTRAMVVLNFSPAMVLAVDFLEIMLKALFFHRAASPTLLA